MFFIGMLIFALIAITVTYKILLGYTALSLGIKLPILFLLTFVWFLPMLLSMMRRLSVVWNGTLYMVLYQVGYFLFGFALVLLILLVARDVVWQVLFQITKNQTLDPNHVGHINLLNLLTIGVAFVVSLYGVFEAYRSPSVRNLTIEDERIKEPVRIVMASDLHINRTSTEAHIQRMIRQINAQNPDYILLGGDVADDAPEYIQDKIKLLSALKAKKIYVSLGNHEFYHRPYAWMIEFNRLGFLLLHNTGEEPEQTGIFVGGVPDVRTTNEINYQRALGAGDGKYRILLSHTPTDFKEIDKSLFDLQLSGHTHGAQIFPFQYITKGVNNGYLAGLYEKDGAKLFVSRGAGYWGPPMRILAPSDIVVVDLKPKNGK